MKKTMSVSVDEGVVRLGRDEAYKRRVSFSQFVEDAIRAFLSILPVPEKRRKPIIGEHDGSDDGPKEQVDNSGKSEAQIIAEGQAKLDATRKDRNIKMDKIEKVRAKVESVTGSSGGYSKSHQVRKKGKGGDAE